MHFKKNKKIVPWSMSFVTPIFSGREDGAEIKHKYGREGSRCQALELNRTGLHFLTLVSDCMMTDFHFYISAE